MKFHEYGFGMYGWYDNRLGIFGGMRSSGFHPAGHEWQDFQIFDLAAPKNSDGSHRVVGSITLLMQFHEEGPPSIRKLRFIEIEKKYRYNPKAEAPGPGYGKAVIAAIQGIIKSDIDVCDLKPKAHKFWKKVGVTPFKKGSSFDGILQANVPKPAFALDETAPKLDWQCQVAKTPEHLTALERALQLGETQSGAWYLTTAGQCLLRDGDRVLAKPIEDAEEALRAHLEPEKIELLDAAKRVNSAQTPAP